MKHADMQWRTMSALDLAAVEAIAAVVHPDFFETGEVLAERPRLYPNGAHLLEIGERPVGYVLSHPWRSGTLPALNALLGELPANPDTYYLHDLAILAVARRMGAADFIVTALARHAAARDFASMSLIAVNNSEGFWTRHGFVAQEVPELTGKLLTYEAGARFMVKPLA